MGLWSSGGEAPRDSSEDGGCAQPIPPVQVDDVLSAGASSVAALLELMEDSPSSRLDAIGLDNLRTLFRHGKYIFKNGEVVHAQIL